MGNRTAIRFVDRSVATDIQNQRAVIYLHWGGAAEYMVDVFGEFFAAVEDQCGADTRYTDADYLASKFVVWMANEQRGSEDDDRRLEFLSVGISTMSVLQAIRAGYHTYAVVASGSNRLRPQILVDEALFTEEGDVAMHQLTDINEYIEAQRNNEEEEEDAQLV